MRATVMHRGQLTVESVRDPQPGPGEVLVRTLTCGICGSDLHAFKYPETLLQPADLERGIVMGHEYCAEIVDYGPATRRNLQIGTRVCAMPLLTRADSIEVIGYSVDYPGDSLGDGRRASRNSSARSPNRLKSGLLSKAIGKTL